MIATLASARWRPKEALRLGLFFCAIATWTSAAHSQPSGSFAVHGVGQSSCARMGSEYAKSPDLIAVIYTSWMEGYTSGLNALFIADGKSSFSNADHEGQWDYVRGWCSNHPLSPFVQAVIHLVAIRKQMEAICRRYHERWCTPEVADGTCFGQTRGFHSVR